MVEELHPVLGAAFSALDDRGVDWLVLRGLDPLPASVGDVDVLAAPEAVPQLDSALLSAGFARLPARGHGSHRFFVAYDAASDTWLEIDVVTSVDFGPYQEFRTALAGPLLARRRQVGRIPVPEVGDGFWHLLLHELLGRGDVAARRRDLLRPLARHAGDHGPFPTLLAGIRPKLSAELAAAVSRGDWATAARLGESLRVAWIRGDRLQVGARRARNRIARHLPPERAGLTIAVLGPDGAGKTTLAEALRATVPIPAESVYLGIWRQSSVEVRLSRIFGAQLAVRLVKLVGKAALIAYHRRLGRLVLLDRYTCDADLPATDLDVWGRISAKLVRHTNAEPDVMILLDAPVELMYARKGEHDVGELQLARDAYLSMRDRFPQMVVVDGAQPRDEVRRQATALLWKKWVRLDGATPACSAAARR
jgi:thymidylate kinase